MALLITDSRRMAVARLEDIEDDSPDWLGAPGAGTGEFDAPGGIAATPDGGFVVADSGNHRIVGFDDIDGSGWDSLGTRGSGVGRFERPAGVAVDSQGRIYVADTGNHRIVRVHDLSGAGWTAYGTAGAPSATDAAAVGKFDSPRGIAVDELERVAIADPKPGRVVRIDGLDGSGWAASAGPPGPRSPVDVAATEDADLAVVDIVDARLSVLAAPTGAPAKATGGGLLYAPVAVASFGSALYALDAGAAAGRLVRLEANGAAIDLSAEKALEPLGFRAPRGLCATAEAP